MATLLRRVTNLLKSRFKGATVDVLESPESKRIGGFLIWDGFKRKDHLRRQLLLDQVFEEELTKPQKEKIAAIFTLTPDEAFHDDE